jgi:hypothetical protein
MNFLKKSQNYYLCFTRVFHFNSLFFNSIIDSKKAMQLSSNPTLKWHNHGKKKSLITEMNFY